MTWHKSVSDNRGCEGTNPDLRFFISVRHDHVRVPFRPPWCLAYGFEAPAKHPVSTLRREIQRFFAKSG
jgi:hypothetical protein